MRPDSRFSWVLSVTPSAYRQGIGVKAKIIILKLRQNNECWHLLRLVPLEFSFSQVLQIEQGISRSDSESPIFHTK